MARFARQQTFPRCLFRPENKIDVAWFGDFFLLVFSCMCFDASVVQDADMISSLSSGITNTIRDAIKFTFAIITYAWLVDHIALVSIQPYWLAVFIAFLVKDFSGYCVHRLNHRVNVLWNRHLIHHSSEDFNLSCALRQSISNTIRFSAIFM